MFNQLEKNDKKGTPNLYTGYTQSFVLRKLKQMEQLGYIKDFTKEHDHNSFLKTQNYQLGVNSTKKHKQYKFSFQLTDKKINEPKDAISLLKIFNLNTDDYIFCRDKNNNLFLKQDKQKVKVKH